MGKTASFEHAVHPISSIWLWIQIFQTILLQGTLSLPNNNYLEDSQGHAKDLNKIVPKMAIFSCPSTLHLSS